MILYLLIMMNLIIKMLIITQNFSIFLDLLIQIIKKIKITIISSIHPKRKRILIKLEEMKKLKKLIIEIKNY